MSAGLLGLWWVEGLEDYKLEEALVVLLELSKVLALVAQLAELSAGMLGLWWGEGLEDHKLEEALVAQLEG